MEQKAASLGFLLYPGYLELDFIGPFDVVQRWSKHSQGRVRSLLLTSDGKPVTSANGLSITGNYWSISEDPTITHLIVPGGKGAREQSYDGRVIHEYLQQKAQERIQFLSVCTGALILGRAGLLKDKKATTHHGSLQLLRDMGDIDVSDSDRYVQNEGAWTSAGVTAGIDMMLAYIATQESPELSQKIAREMEYTTD